jgi:hypothetical protein
MDSAGFAYALLVFSGGVVVCVVLLMIMVHMVSRQMDREMAADRKQANNGR